MKYVPITVLVIICCYTAMADSWPAPREKDYYSTDSSYYVRIVPTFIPEKYWKWVNASAKKKKKFSPQDTTIVPSHAIMFKRTVKGDSMVWKQKLINQIAPVTALVSDNGQYLVTFDNWHSMGYGVDVLAVYDEKGLLIKRHMLEDISPFPINTYQISISSILWRCGEQFIGNNQVEICFRNEEKEIIRRIYDISELKIKEDPQ